MSKQQVPLKTTIRKIDLITSIELSNINNSNDLKSRLSKWLENIIKHNQYSKVSELRVVDTKAVVTRAFVSLENLEDNAALLKVFDDWRMCETFQPSPLYAAAITRGYVRMVTHEEKSADLVAEIKELKNKLDFVVDQNKNLEDWLYRELDDKKAREKVATASQLPKRQLFPLPIQHSKKLFATTVTEPTKTPAATAKATADDDWSD